MASTPTPTSRPPALGAGSPVRRWLPWALLAVVVVGCLSVAAFGSRSAPTAQDRVTSISRSVYCPTCGGQSVAESNAPSAQEVKVEIARRIQSGESDDEIRTYFVSIWGQEILTTPPTTGVSALVWVVPVAAFAVAVAFLVIVFRRWSQETPEHATAADEALVAEALQREHDQAVADEDPHGEGSSR
jgi:cytochrome c-type biogenesis protein CcmH